MQIGRRRYYDLIDRDPVFATLDADRVRARRLKEYLRAQHSYAPTIVLPSPAAETAAGAVFQIDLRAGRGADAKDGGAATIDAIGKLYPDGIVTPEVVLCLTSDPQTIWPAGFGCESHLKIVWRVYERCSDLRHSCIRMMDARSGGSAYV